MSSFELPKGFTKPIDTNLVFAIPEYVVDAQQKLQAMRKLALILKSKTTLENHFAVGDMVEIFSSTGMDKTGTCSTPKIVLLVDPNSRTITVPGKSGKRVNVLIEDVRLALPDDSFAKIVQNAS